MIRRPHDPPVTKERFPEHPDDIREWRDTVTGFVISLGVVLLIFGIIALSLVGTAEYMHSPTGMTPDIQDATTTGRAVCFILLLVGGGVVVAGSLMRFNGRRPTVNPSP